LLDVTILGRFTHTGNNEMMMSCLRIYLVVLAILAVLSCPQGLKAMRWAAILTILLTSGSSIAEFMGLASFSSIPGRFSGFNGHPNSPPIVLCQCLGLCFALISSFRWNMVLIAAAMPGVALTYGRSGMVIFAFICASYILLNLKRNWGFLLVCCYAIVPLLLGGLAVMEEKTAKGIQKDKNTSDRLEAIYNLDFEKLKSPERAKDLSDAWDAVWDQPLFGHGIGAASARWAPHNEYIAMWLEQGVFGLLVYLGTLYIPALRSVMQRGRAGLAVLALLLYSPIAQGRIMDAHFYFTLFTAAHVLWPSRARFVLARQSSDARVASA
jgi:O-antigen ligase